MPITPDFNEVRYGTTPVLTRGTSGQWDFELIDDFHVFEDQNAPGTYRMVYTGYAAGPTNGQVGLASAPAPTGPWTKYASNPLLPTLGSGADATGLGSPFMYQEGGTYYLFYFGTTSAGYEQGTLSICVASATNLLGPWTRHGAIITTGGTGWRQNEIYGPCVVKSGSSYYLFFNGLAASGLEYIGYATASSLTGPWTVDDVNSPVINPGGGSTWDSHIVGEPYVFRCGNTWFMAYYGAQGGYTNASDGWATTTDALFPLGWTKWVGNPAITPLGTGWDSAHTAKPSILLVGSILYHYYAGSVTGPSPSAREPGLAIGSFPVDPGFWVDLEDDDVFGDSEPDADAPLARMLPEGTSGLSDDLTEWLISYTIDRGVTAELTGGSPIDTATFVLKNDDGQFNPDNTSSPYYNLLVPRRRVWLGVLKATGLLSGSGDPSGRFAGYIREITPIPAAGATSAPTVQILCDGILSDFARTPVRLPDSTERSQYDYRVALLDAMGIDEDHRDLAVEADTLPLSSADSTNALAVLEDLNRATGTRHFIAPQASKFDWFKYTTRNRHDKLGAAADASVDAGSQHVTTVDGWRFNNDGIINSQRATVDPVNFPFALSQIWTYDNIPFPLNGNLTLWANFEDYVGDPTLGIDSTGAAVTSLVTPFGRSARIDLYSSGATVTALTISGRQVERASGVTVSADNLPETAPSQAKYGVRSGTDLAGDLIGARASAQGIVDHIVWRYGTRPLKRPSLTVVNWFPTMFTLDPYDLLAVTLDQVNASAVKFDIVGINEQCIRAANSSVVSQQITFRLSESRIQGTQTWFTLDSSTLGGPDLLGY